MNVNGIGTTGYPAWQGARKAQQNAAGRSFAEQVNNVAGAKPHTSIVYMKTDDMLYSGGNGTGLSFYIKYAEGSTEDDPTVIAKGVDENGNEFEQTIHINKINPRNASLVEMTALESYMGVDKNGGLTSLPPETGMMGLHDRTNFMDMFQKQISDMKLLSQKKSCGILPVQYAGVLGFHEQEINSIGCISPISHRLTRQGGHPRRSGKTERGD